MKKLWNLNKDNFVNKWTQLHKHINHKIKIKKYIDIKE